MTTEQSTLEKISEYMHNIWTKRYLHQKGNIDIENINRLERQARTTYQNLSHEDQEKDRKLAMEILEIIKK